GEEDRVGSDPRHGRDGRQGTDPPARIGSVKIYTRTGDRGETSLFGGARVPKNDARIESYGTIDELNSHLGVARATWPDSPIDAQLLAAQRDLFEIGAHLAS